MYTKLAFEFAFLSSVPDFSTKIHEKEKRYTNSNSIIAQYSLLKSGGQNLSKETREVSYHEHFSIVFLS